MIVYKQMYILVHFLIKKWYDVKVCRNKGEKLC